MQREGSLFLPVLNLPTTGPASKGGGWGGGVGRHSINIFTLSSPPIYQQAPAPGLYMATISAPTTPSSRCRSTWTARRTCSTARAATRWTCGSAATACATVRTARTRTAAWCWTGWSTTTPGCSPPPRAAWPRSSFQRWWGSRREGRNENVNFFNFFAKNRLKLRLFTKIIAKTFAKPKIWCLLPTPMPMYVLCKSCHQKFKNNTKLANC